MKRIVSDINLDKNNSGKYEKHTRVLLNGCTFRSNLMCHITECKTTMNESFIQSKCIFDDLQLKILMKIDFFHRMS